MKLFDRSRDEKLTFNELAGGVRDDEASVCRYYNYYLLFKYYVCIQNNV